MNIHKREASGVPRDSSRFLWFTRRWMRLLSYAVGHFVTDMLMNITATLDGSAWYFGNMLVLLGIVVALAVWGFYTSLGGRLWATETLTVGAASARP